MQMVALGPSALGKRNGKGAASSEEFASVARSAASVRKVNAGVRPAIPALRAAVASSPSTKQR